MSLHPRSTNLFIFNLRAFLGRVQRVACCRPFRKSPLAPAAPPTRRRLRPLALAADSGEAQTIYKGALGWVAGRRQARYSHPRSDATEGQHGVCGCSHDNGKGEGAKDVAQSKYPKGLIFMNAIPIMPHTTPYITQLGAILK